MGYDQDKLFTYKLSKINIYKTKTNKRKTEEHSGRKV